MSDTTKILAFLEGATCLSFLTARTARTASLIFSIVSSSYRPRRDHDGLFAALHRCEDLLRDKRHVRMKKLEACDQDFLKSPQSSHPAVLIIRLVKSGLDHLDVPVAELVPHEVIDLLDCDAELEFIHIIRHSLNSIVEAGQNPLVLRADRLSARRTVSSSEPSSGRFIMINLEAFQILFAKFLFAMTLSS